jgi:hypothetical protein
MYSQSFLRKRTILLVTLLAVCNAIVATTSVLSLIKGTTIYLLSITKAHALLHTFSSFLFSMVDEGMGVPIRTDKEERWTLLL